METFLVLSDTVQIALIGAVASIFLIVIPLLFKMVSSQVKITTKMDGLQDLLMTTTEALGIAKGKQIAKDELKQEQKESGTSPEDFISKIADNKHEIETQGKEIEKLKTNPEPMSVIVKNPEPIPVITKKDGTK